jgi:hypothetical protein
MSEWQTMETAPFQTVIEVRNASMADPVLATRGYETDLGVHPDNTFCTSVFTPDVGLCGFPAGRMVCPTHWRLPPPSILEGGG